MPTTAKIEYGKHLMDMLLILNKVDSAYKLFSDKVGRFRVVDLRTLH